MNQEKTQANVKQAVPFFGVSDISKDLFAIMLMDLVSTCAING